MHLADLPGRQPLLDGQEAAAKPLRVAHAGIHAGLLDGREDSRRLAGVGGQRLLDEQLEPALDGGQRRRRMVVLVREDHRGVHFRPAEQLFERRREEIGAGVFRQLPADFFPCVA